jgi:hypothetical protein
MLLGTNIPARRSAIMETLAKSNSSINLGLPIEKEKGRDFTGIHGIDRVVRCGPNTSPKEMASGNGGIRGTEMLRGSFGGTGGGERERSTGVERGNWEDNPHPVLFSQF